LDDAYLHASDESFVALARRNSLQLSKKGGESDGILPFVQQHRIKKMRFVARKLFNDEATDEMTDELAAKEPRVVNFKSRVRGVKHAKRIVENRTGNRRERESEADVRESWKQAGSKRRTLYEKKNVHAFGLERGLHETCGLFENGSPVEV
jgi:hypothetical protein